MSATIRLYQMSKKTISTATPAGLNLTPLASISGEFRQPLDIMHPVVVVEDTAVGGSSIFTRSNPVNYAQIYTGASDRNRLYWIDKIIWLSDKLVELHMSEDSLGTWSYEIRSSTQYVLRSESHSNPYIVDSSRQLITEGSKQVTDISSSIPWWNVTPPNGYYVVGIMSSGFSPMGSTCYYRMNADSFEDLREQLMSSTTWTGMLFNDIEPDLYKSLFNPFQYITSCMWYPICPDANVGTKVTSIRFGWWSLSFTGSNGAFPLAHPNYGNTITGLATPSSHGQASSKAYYLNSEPYRKVQLIIPPFGTIPIDTTLLAYPANQNSLDATYNVDYVTGKIHLRITRNATGVILADKYAQLGVPILVAQATQDFLGMAGGVNQMLQGAAGAAGGLITAGTGFFTGNAGSMISGGLHAAAGASNAAIGLGSAVSSFAPSVSSSGADGSFLYCAARSYCITINQYVTALYEDEVGYPYGYETTLSSLTGFCRCGGAHVTWSGCNASERTAIESALDSGIVLGA